jgi:hypothetical protein
MKAPPPHEALGERVFTSLLATKRIEWDVYRRHTPPGPLRRLCGLAF